MVVPDKRRPSRRLLDRLTLLARLGAAALAAVALAACIGPGEGITTDGNPPGLFPVAPATSQGDEIFTLYPIVFWIAVAVFVLVEGWLIWIVLRYRRRRGDDALPSQTHGHNGLEILWTLIPAVIVTGLFVATIDRLGRIDHLSDEPNVVVDVTAFRFQWQLDYPNEGIGPFIGGGTVGPVMVVPVNETVRVRLTATDVIHSFYVPQFLYKRDAVPGRMNEFDVLVREPGTYGGQCAEFCGLNHADMFFTVEAVPRAQYDAWVAENRQQGPSPTPPADGHQIELETPDEFTFIPASLTAPANTPIVFTLHNTDDNTPHNVAIEAANPDGSDWSGLPIANAGQTVTYISPPLAAGSYEFYCSVHANTMRGSLTVTP